MIKLDNLFVIRSPLQLINCIEAINYFNLKDNILVIIYNNTENTNKQIDNLIDLYPWKNIIRLNQEQKRSKFFIYIALIKKLKKERYNYLFFGDFGSIYKLIIANVKKNQVWYVDDGVGTINVYKSILVDNTLNKLSSRMLRFLLAGLSIKIKDDINLFTYFDLKPLKHSKVIYNGLEYFSKQYLQNSVNDDIVYILGQPLVETNLLLEDDYFYYLDSIKSMFDKKIIYIPHRTEVIDERMNRYKSDDFEILEIDVPVELYFMNQKINPYHIVSFLTTALFTLKKLYKKTKYSYIYIPSDKILERKEDVENIYKIIKTLNIDTILLKSNNKTEQI